MKNVNLSKDGKSLTFDSTFFSETFRKTETTYISADNEFCIYEFILKEDVNGRITITGCENEVREMSIFPTNSAPFYFKIYPNGKVEEIILPPKIDTPIFPDNLRTGGKERMGGLINTNANTNKNPGAKVTINSRAPEVPSNGNGDGRSDGYGRWGYKPYYHRSGGAPKAPKGQGEVRQGKRTGGKGKDLILVNLLTRTCLALVHNLFFYQYFKKKWET